jgi:hypothetical protein
MIVSRSMIRVLTFASIFCAATGVLAQETSRPRENPPPGRRDHTHLGVYLRLDLGVGYESTRLSGGNGRLDGGAGALSVALGGAVAPGWIVAGDLWATGTGDPTFHPASGGPTSKLNGSTLSFVGLGPQLTHYFGDNFYFSVTPSITGAVYSVNDSGQETRTDAGIGVAGSIGKEWWVSPRWGIGMELQGWFSSNHQTDGGPTWTLAGSTLAFCATFN